MPMAIERRPDGPVLVGEPEKTAEFDAGFLEQADPRYVTVTDGVITLVLDNGTWRYRITGGPTPHGTYLAELLAADPAA